MRSGFGGDGGRGRGAAAARDQELRRAGRSLRVAVMGCVVNGPGEAREAAVGIAGGKGKGVLFVEGKPVATVPEGELVERLVEAVRRVVKERVGMVQGGERPKRRGVGTAGIRVSGTANGQNRRLTDRPRGIIMLSSSFVHVRGMGRRRSSGCGSGACGIGSRFFSALRRGTFPRPLPRVVWAVAQSVTRSAGRGSSVLLLGAATTGALARVSPVRTPHSVLGIETTGCPRRHAVTMIGVYDGSGKRTYVKGEDLQEFAEDIGQYQLLVTCNDAGFDLLPFSAASPAFGRSPAH